MTFKRAEEWPLFLHVVFNLLSNWIQHLYCRIQLDKSLDIARGKSGHSSALLNVILKFKLLECKNNFLDTYTHKLSSIFLYILQSKGCKNSQFQSTCRSNSFIIMTLRELISAIKFVWSLNRWLPGRMGWKQCCIFPGTHCSARSMCLSLDTYFNLSPSYHLYVLFVEISDHVRFCLQISYSAILFTMIMEFVNYGSFIVYVL